MPAYSFFQNQGASPLARYDAATLEVGQVSAWPSFGSLANMDALPVAASPTCLVDSDGRQFVRFSGSDELRTSGLLGLAGHDEHALVVVSRNYPYVRNQVGYGVASNGQMADYYTADNFAAEHFYGTDVGGQSNAAPQNLNIGVYTRAQVDATGTGGYVLQDSIYFNGALVNGNGVTQAQQLANSTLVLGNGNYTPLNNNGPCDLYFVEWWQLGYTPAAAQARYTQLRLRFA